MFCQYCGTESINEAAKFCRKCGKPFGQAMNPGIVQETEKNALPAGVYYDQQGHINWFYKGRVTDKNDATPVGTEFVIRYEFGEKELIRYRKEYIDHKPDEKTERSKASKAFYGAMDVLADLTILFSDNDSLVDSAMMYSDLREEMSEVVGQCAYKKVKSIESRPADDNISIKYGIDRFNAFVMPEQTEYVLQEIMKRCPGCILKK